MYGAILLVSIFTKHLGDKGSVSWTEGSESFQNGLEYITQCFMNHTNHY